jgi:serine protease inhibitor
LRYFIVILFTLLSLTGIAPVSAQPDSSNPVTDLNAFAFDLYGKVSDSSQNTIFSPYSLSSLLGILVAGSAGKTHEQLVNVLHLNADENLNNLNAELDKLNTMLISSGSNNAFAIGNALWADESFTYKNSFLNNMKSYHNINFFRVDFAHAPDQARDKINSWVGTATKGYIKKLFDNIPDTAKLVLTNAVYFKGLWTLPFEASGTESGAFTSGGGSKTQVPMMHQQDKFYYAENDMLQMLQMDYMKSTLAMVVLLSKPRHDLQEIRQALTNTLFLQLIQSSIPVQVNVSFPKFKVESTFNSLSQSLQALGLTDAFNANKANFSNITNDKLFISQVIQKAVIQVDEKGTVAAAATGMVMTATAIMPAKPVDFIADHPFLFIIFDKQSGVIVFMGQVTNP